ncbi:DUF1353 domain-containing protein [Arundinibacter roseus]|uniref:DUF1353 domain-containing protein n=1 Tax=Arundinibacter roseus TaxID=2070510 RepID=A0A4R4KH27_9BACT|nr:DUF1353 domain-containing protein [Arundinibacter roseus]TDB67103.1 DUF1353 domain-containing protein [Arundinibacter roseus]
MTKYPDIRLRKCVEPHAKIDWFEIAEDCDCGKMIITAGYKTDFASVPRILWSVFPPHGRWTNAAIKHDWWYDQKVMENELGPQEARYWADHDFLFDMLREGVPKWQAYLFYGIVRLFGRKWWVT